jgi:hypothetical protein
MRDCDQSGNEDSSSPCGNRGKVKELNSFAEIEIAIGSSVSVECSTDDEADFKAQTCNDGSDPIQSAGQQ